MYSVHADPHIEVDDINAGVFQESKFFEFIHRHTFWMLSVLYLPKQFVWKEVKQFPLSIKRGRLRKEVVKYSTERWMAVERWYTKGDERRARKNIVHSLRGFMFGAQLLTEGTISKWDAANQLYYQVMKDDIPNWQICNEKYKPLFDEFAKKFDDTFRATSK